MRGVLASFVLAIALVACATRLPDDEPTPRPSPLPTRIARTATPEATPTPAPSPTIAAVRRVFTQADFDPYAALYASEREGIYVTTRNAGGRYYYRWDDRRWMSLTNRVWFRTLDDLHTVFPARMPAP